jgi:hypothetical protein
LSVYSYSLSFESWILFVDLLMTFVSWLLYLPLLNKLNGRFWLFSAYHYYFLPNRLFSYMWFLFIWDKVLMSQNHNSKSSYHIRFYVSVPGTVIFFFSSF